MKRYNRVQHGLLTSAIVSIIFSSAAHAGFLDKITENKKLQNLVDEVTKEEAPAEPAKPAAIATATDPATAAVDPKCPQVKVKTLSTGDKLKAQVLKSSLKSAFKDIDTDNIVMPDKIRSLCDADKRLSYIERSTNYWAHSLAEAVEQAASALQIDTEVEAARMFAEGTDYTGLSETEIVDFRKDVGKDMKKIEAAIKEKEAVNQEVLSEASAKMRAASLYGAVIAGWDERMFDFMSDDLAWTYRNWDRVKLFEEHVSLLGDSMKSLNGVMKAYNAVNTDGEKQKTYEQIVAKREAENVAFDAKVTKDLEL